MIGTALWVTVVAGSLSCYLLKLAGLSVPAAWVEQPWVARIVDFVPAALLAALVAVQALTSGNDLVLDGRLVGLAVAAIALALRAPAPLIATAQAMGGVGMGIFSAVWLTTLQQHVPEEALSRVSAWDWMGSFLFLPLGLIAAGPVSDLIGISTTLWISVAWAVLSTLVVLLVPSVRNLRRLDDPVEPERQPARVGNDLVARPEGALGGLHQTVHVVEALALVDAQPLEQAEDHQ